MHRKQFLSSLLPLAAAIGQPVTPEERVILGDDERKHIIPPYLVTGDTIGITSPAGYITQEEVQPAILQIESWGMKIKMGVTIGKRDYTFGGTDDERAHDFQQMLDDVSIKAILCARGGYGAVRIIDRLNFSKFVKHPKWIIGFSDITVMHSHLNHNYGIASIHSKMCNSFPDDWSKAEPIQVDTILSIRHALTGEKMNYTAIPNTANRQGTASGILSGGNLRTIETLTGTASDLHTDGTILFVEDTGEYLYSIDRMFWNLKRTGKLAGLKALIVGGFKIKPDDTPDDAFGRTVQDIVLEKVNEYNYPVCFDFPVGHQKNNYALKCGVPHRLDINDASVRLAEV